jgi:VWFA-related protein
MTPSRRYAALLGLTIFGPIAARQTDSVIRVTVDLVQVDAVVTDSRGRHIPGLKSEDFTVLEDGKPQNITHFSYVTGSTQGGGPAPLPVDGEPALPAKPLTREQVQRTIVMMADDLALSADDIPNVRTAMKSFVDRHMQAGDLVSVTTTSGGMGILAQLTNDKRQLYAAIDRIHYVPGRTV